MLHAHCLSKKRPQKTSHGDQNGVTLWWQMWLVVHMTENTITITDTKKTYFASGIVTVVVVTFQWVNECIVFNYSHVIFNCIKEMDKNQENAKFGYVSVMKFLTYQRRKLHCLSSLVGMSRCTVSRGIWREDTILIFIWVLKTEKKEEILDKWWKKLTVLTLTGKFSWS